MTSLAVYPALRRRPPWFLTAPAALCTAGMLLPLAYLVIRAAEGDAQLLRETVFRQRTLSMLGNTMGLAAAVLATVTLLGLPLAWLTTRTDLRARAWLTLLATMPLAIPGYLMAYALLSIGGEYGTARQLMGISVPRLSGFWGAWLALSLYNLPYMFLNLRVALQRIDPAIEEAARSLGHTPPRVFTGVMLPQLRPALMAGGLLVALHVIGDFGAVSLMRFETFSYALAQQFENNQHASAAWLGLVVVTITAVLLVLEVRFLRGLRLDPTGAAVTRVLRPVRLGRWTGPAYAFVFAIAAAGVLLPLLTIIYWSVRSVERQAIAWEPWWRALADSLSVAIPAAAVTSALAVPLAYLARRYPSRASSALERSAYIGYATPPIAFALGLVFFTLLLPRTLDGWGLAAAGAAVGSLYQSFALLIAAYALHFLAEAIGPVRSALYVASPRAEEAARSLGCGRFEAFVRVTLPLLRPGLVASAALVFLSVVKELPITYILSPLNFQPLSMRVWDYTNEAMYAQAAPYALTILVVSGAFVGLLLARGREEKT